MSQGGDADQHGPGAVRRHRARVSVAVGLILAGIAVACIWAWPSRKPAVAPAHGPDDEWPDPVVANPGYLGPDACVACHAERVAEFRRTNHYHACRRPEDSPMPPGFTQGRGAVPTDMPGLHFEMTRSGDSFVHTSVNAAPTGEQRLTDRISLAFGAGGLDEVYFAWRGDLLYELPVAWLHPLDRWGHNPLRKYYSGDYARTGTGRCQECHNTWFEQIPGSVNRYRPESFILGVTCERCHGPGREHVAFHQAHPRADSTHAIINPARLSRERLLEVCTQCHSNAVGSRGPRFAYRPGEPLADYFRILETRHPEDDHVANQVTYLRQSKCFQRSDTLTCTTCHNPHRQTDHAAVRRSCLSCHEPAACRERPRVPAAVRDDCAGCHMPPRVWMNVHFDTADDRIVPPIRRSDHRIAIYPEARDAVQLEWYRSQADAESQRQAARLTRKLSDYWLAEADARAHSHRFLAAIGATREALRVDPGPAVRQRLEVAIAAHTRVTDEMDKAVAQIGDRRYREAIDTLNDVLRLKPDLADAHAELGTAYAGAGETEQAVKQWREVARCDSNNAYGYIMIGWLALLEGRPNEAVEMYRRADEVDPHNAETAYRLGLGLDRLGRLPEATDAFRRTIEIDPNHPGGHQRLSDMLRRQDQAADAVRHALRAARLTKFENADVLMTLAAAYVAADRRRDAEAIADKILSATDREPPEVQRVIREKLAELRLVP